MGPRTSQASTTLWGMQVEQIARAQREAMMDGLRAHGVSGAAYTGVRLVIFPWSRRRYPPDGGAGTPEK